MEGIKVVIIIAVLVFVFIVLGYIIYTVNANRKFKPIEIHEAEILARNLIQKRYGKGRDFMKLFYDDFIKEFPGFDNYNYTYVLQCLNPNNRNRKNPDLVESALIFLGNPQLVVGSVRHDSYLNNLKI